MNEKKRIFISSPTMHGEEMQFIQEAFDTNWVAPLGANVDGFEGEIGLANAIISASTTVPYEQVYQQYIQKMPKHCPENYSFEVGM